MGDDRCQLGELGRAPDEGQGAELGPRRRRAVLSVGSGLVFQQVQVNSPGLARRIKAEILGQSMPVLLVAFQGRDPIPRSAKRPHQRENSDLTQRFERCRRRGDLDRGRQQSTVQSKLRGAFQRVLAHS
jgi:hypothetical protein